MAKEKILMNTEPVRSPIVMSTSRERMVHYDWRNANPKLHLLYVKWAVQHIKTVRSCMQKLDNFSNCNLMDIVAVMDDELRYLINSNPAYMDAAEILELSSYLPKTEATPAYLLPDSSTLTVP